MRGHLTLTLALLSLCLALAGRAQNLVAGDASGRTAPPVSLAEKDVQTLLHRVPEQSAAPKGPEALRVVRKLDRHVAEFLAGFPFAAFQHTLGISGHEIYFNHPDRMFYALSLALPHLSKPTAEKTRRFLAAQLATSPPYALAGWENQTGPRREAYDVPAELRIAGQGQAASAFGVYAFWTYCRAAGPAAARAHWPAVKARIQPLLTRPYLFDIRKQDYRDDQAQKLNGDLAGLLGIARLAQWNGDAATETTARGRTLQLLELRVNLERVNPKILEPTNSSTKHLHVHKLARHCDLTPEVAESLRAYTEGLAAERLRAFRESRNGWYLAFGDRLIGGENYTNPPHFSHALFTGAALVEKAPSAQLLGWVDVPWCKGDFYFIEKCALALGSRSQPDALAPGKER